MHLQPSTSNIRCITTEDSRVLMKGRNLAGCRDLSKSCLEIDFFFFVVLDSSGWELCAMFYESSYWEDPWAKFYAKWMLLIKFTFWKLRGLLASANCFLFLSCMQETRVFKNKKSRTEDVHVQIDYRSNEVFTKLEASYSRPTVEISKATGI